MLILKSDHSLTSDAVDRMAVDKAKALAKAAGAAGWPNAVLADERTMAGTLEFLAAAKGGKTVASAGVSVSGLTTRGGAMSVIMFALDQDGLRKLVSINAGLAVAQTLEQVLELLPRLDEASASQRTMAMILVPGRGFNASRAGDLKALTGGRGVGVAVALYDVNGQEARHAPRREAEELQAATGIPLVQLSGAYSIAEITPALNNALVAITKQKSARVKRTEDALPQAFASTSIPTYDPASFAEAAGRNAVALFSRIRPTSLERKPTLPSRIGLEDGESADAKMERLTREGMAERIARGRIVETGETRARLETELALILKLGFSNYFLIMREAVGYARSVGIPVGPGRGSAAGSLVAYALGLTDIDPIRHKLFFERFINPERVSLPDIDTDFCEERRSEVISHMARKYGDDRVAQIATYGMRKPRGAIRDAGRALGLRGASEEAIREIKLNSREKDESDFETILADHPDDDVRRVLELALQLKGMAANAGVHAGGVVISDDPIDLSAPVSAKRSDTGRQIIEFDMKGTEGAGLVKFDFLGLKTLTVIADALRALREAGHAIDIDMIDDEDPLVYEMIRRGSTRTVFQLESGGMTRAAMEIGIDKFEDIVALVALYRPGPMGNIPIYGLRKKGVAKVEYLHPDLEPILADTYGVIIYQEQIMQMAQIWAGYSMAEADLLRRAIGKKIASEVEAARIPFCERSDAFGRNPETTRKLFAYIVPFAAYGFNRSHAAAYATITYQTAWLKRHHPGAWYAAALSHDEEAESRADTIAEAARAGIRIRDPGINRSRPGFRWVGSQDRHEIILPLEAVKGVGGPAAAAAIAERDRNGAFKSMRELMSRTSAFNKAQLENLANAGAMDDLSPYPATVARPNLAKVAREERTIRAPTALGGAQMGLFAADEMPFLFDPEPSEPPTTPEKAAELQQELLQGLMVHERRTIASSAWRRRLENLQDLAKAAAVAKTMVCNTMGIVVDVKDRMAFVAGTEERERIFMLTLEDETGRRTFEVGRDCLNADALAISQGRAVRITLEPSRNADAMIAGRPTIRDVLIYRDPTEEPREHPVVVVDFEIDEVRRRQIVTVLQRISTAGAAAPRRRKAADADRASRGLPTTHVIVAPPSNKLEIFPLPGKARLADIGEGFSVLDGFRRYLD